MRRKSNAGLLCGFLFALVSATAPAAPAWSSVRASETAPAVTVTLDQHRADVGPGEKVSFTSTVANVGDRDVTDLVAHLNVLTTDADVYVDPEDWSPRRTEYVDALAAGDTVDISWNVQAVTSGPLVLFVSVTSLTGDQVVSSGPLRMTVHGQRVVDATRVLPSVVWAPAVLVVLLGVTLLRRRRHR
jgi:hypothetical protein